MRDHRVILVTGVADYWGRRVAKYLVANPLNHVIGVDSDTPEEEIVNLDFIRADVRNPIFDEILRAEDVEAVLHLKFFGSPLPGAAASEINVSGAINVLKACGVVGIKKVVVKSSTAVYGAKHNNPAFLMESSALKANRKYDNIRDLLELESYYASFEQRFPNLELTVLRFANIVGLTADTPMTRFLKSRPCRILLGFDPLMQVIHEGDVTASLVHALDADFSGSCNIAAPDPMPLSRILRLAGSLPLRIHHRLAYKGSNFLEAAKCPPRKYFPLELDYLRFPCVVDTTCMEERLSFTPKLSAEETLQEFAGRRQIGNQSDKGNRLVNEVEGLRKLLDLRRKERETRI